MLHEYWRSLQHATDDSPKNVVLHEYWRSLQHATDDSLKNVMLSEYWRSLQHATDDSPKNVMLHEYWRPVAVWTCIAKPAGWIFLKIVADGEPDSVWGVAGLQL